MSKAHGFYCSEKLLLNIVNDFLDLPVFDIVLWLSLINQMSYGLENIVLKGFLRFDTMNPVSGSFQRILNEKSGHTLFWVIYNLVLIAILLKLKSGVLALIPRVFQLNVYLHFRILIFILAILPSHHIAGVHDKPQITLMELR